MAFIPVSVHSPPIKIRSAFSKSSIAVPSAKNSGFDRISYLTSVIQKETCVNTEIQIKQMQILNHYI